MPVVKVANPRSRARKRSSRPRKLSRKQVLAGFGGKRRKAAAKSGSRSSSRRKAAPAKRKRSTTRKSNPPSLMLTLGAVNPKRSSMARKRKTTRRRRRKNATRSVTRHYSVTRRRRSNPTRRRTRRATSRRVTRRRRRNPSASSTAKQVLAGLVGVAATKFLPTALPVGQIGASNIGRVGLSVVAAMVSGWVAGKITKDRDIEEFVRFGGFMQAASVGLNVFVPALGRQLSLAGLAPSQNFYAPQNMMAMPAPAAPVAQSGISRAWRRSW